MVTLIIRILECAWHDPELQYPDRHRLIPDVNMHGDSRDEMQDRIPKNMANTPACIPRKQKQSCTCHCHINAMNHLPLLKTSGNPHRGLVLADENNDRYRCNRPDGTKNSGKSIVRPVTGLLIKPGRHHADNENIYICRQLIEIHGQVPAPLKEHSPIEISRSHTKQKCRQREFFHSKCQKRKQQI